MSLTDKSECINPDGEILLTSRRPPYSPEDATNPLQFYGRTKALGEQAVLETRAQHGPYAVGKGCVVLRVPILYGEVEYNAETAVNIFVDVIESGKETKSESYCACEIAQELKWPFQWITLLSDSPPTSSTSPECAMTSRTRLASCPPLCISLRNGPSPNTR